jgi:hypothetical protein
MLMPYTIGQYQVVGLACHKVSGLTAKGATATTEVIVERNVRSNITNV